MTSVRIAFTELERLLSGGLARLAVFAMILVPALFGGLYLYANHDPYDGLSSVPAALVVLDEGAERPNGDRFNAGTDVAAELAADDAFDWQVVSEAEAEDGVEDGSYEFALTIPTDFSTALTSAARPEQPLLTVTTDDANAYISTSMADRITDTVRDALADQVGTGPAASVPLGLAGLRGDLAAATKGAGRLNDGLTDSTTEARRLANDSSDVVDRARELASANREASSAAGDIRTVAGNVSREYQRIRAAILTRMAQAGFNSEQRRYIMQAYDALGGQIRGGSARLQGVANDLASLAGGSERLTERARDVGRGADDLRNSLARMRKASADLERGLKATGKEVPAAGESAAAEESGTAAGTTSALGDPVEIRNVAETEADSYGEGLLPFLLAVAAWLGAFAVLLLVRPLSTRAMSANQAPFRVAIGGWLTPALLGVLQMALVAGGVLLVVDVVPEDIPLMIALLLLTSATFIAIVHCLNVWFGLAGQFFALVLLVVQLVTAGGTFPWQTIPEPLHWLHHVLPMSYAVDGLRQLMYGGDPELVAFDAAVLFAWLVVAITLTAVAARRQRTWTVKRIKPELAL